MTLKQFMMISQKTPMILTTEMMNKDLDELCNYTAEVNKDKWTKRTLYQEITRPNKPPKTPNNMKGVPNNWCYLLKTQQRLCPKCQKQGKNTITTS